MKSKEGGGRWCIAEEGPGEKRARRRAVDRAVDTRIRPEPCMTSYEDRGVAGASGGAAGDGRWGAALPFRP